MKHSTFEFRQEDDIESSKQGLERITNTISQIRELVENEFAKGVNTWTRCVATHLGNIMTEAQWLNTNLVTQEYKNRVEKDGAEILAEIRKLDEPKQEHIKEEFDRLATDPEEKKFKMPTEDEQNYIHSLIFSLAPRQDELK